MMIAALFVRKDSIYKSIPGVDCYDIGRDARTWPGGCPVIAHPPCRSWGMLKHFARAPAGEHEFGIRAVEQVRRWGGVVEHPMGSSLFRECGCPPPGGFPDIYGGWTIVVDQFHWGHPARKRTILYIVGTMDMPPMPFRPGEPEFVIDRPGKRRKSERRPSGKKSCSHRKREETPRLFAEWLVEMVGSFKGTDPANRTPLR